MAQDTRQYKRRLTTQQKWTGLVFFLCVLPYVLMLLGVDFSSINTSIKADPFDNGKIKSDQMFYALSGALHHALL
jgi:hypothetical protein